MPQVPLNGIHRSAPFACCKWCGAPGNWTGWTRSRPRSSSPVVVGLGRHFLAGFHVPGGGVGDFVGSLPFPPFFRRPPHGTP
ncbi:hypothetical protein TNCV_335711 [Trichonephila clavipes]|nr:hypothetical protein TNCV_335711 [Trichonephila clavipes]